MLNVLNTRIYDLHYGITALVYRSLGYKCVVIYFYPDSGVDIISRSLDPC